MFFVRSCLVFRVYAEKGNEMQRATPLKPNLEISHVFRCPLPSSVAVLLRRVEPPLINTLL